MSEFDDEEYESFDLDTRDEDADDEDDVEDSSDDEDDLEDSSDDEDDLEDASDDEIDFVLATYREDGQVQVQALRKDLANDLEELIRQLRRLPADAGALGFVSLVEEILILVRVRGQHVQVLLSDGSAAGDWPIARDVVDLLGDEIPDEDETDPLGDLSMLTDLGLSEFDLSSILDDLDLDSDQMVLEIGDRLKLGPDFRRAVEAALPD
jgi:putative tRNA adenosine deaminase-associated protein